VEIVLVFVIFIEFSLGLLLVMGPDWLVQFFGTRMKKETSDVQLKIFFRKISIFFFIGACIGYYFLTAVNSYVAPQVTSTEWKAPVLEFSKSDH
jgi:hypothetical protein